jgi:uncharacterized cupredoxin-like copper-binding protein/mono/diheme cytochrome c family protein
MNTSKQINAMVVILFIALIAVGAYSIWDTDRSESSEDDQFNATIERGAETFALNCRVCHGDAGQGGQAGGRLAAAAILDSPTLQGIEDGAFDQTAFDEAFDHITDTITCGRVGTQMPVWGESQGGTLNEEQIRQLATLITQGIWEPAQHHADELDAETLGHVTLEDDDGGLDSDETDVTVSNAAPFAPGQRIRVTLAEAEGEEAAEGAPTEERMLILPRQIEIERGVGGTEAAEHTIGTELVLADPEDGEDAETGITVAGVLDLDTGTIDASTPVAPDTASIVVSDLRGIDEEDVLLLDDERVEVASIMSGIPSTLQQLIAEIGKTPERVLVSGAEGIEEDMTVRVDGELLRVLEISDEGDAGITLMAELSASNDVIDVSDPAFFRPNYVTRLGDELIRVKDAVETGQTLGDTIGRAETTFALSGTDGLEEGMIIRIESELMRIVSLEPASLTLQRGAAATEGGEESQAAAHDAGATLVEIPEEPTDGEAPAVDLEEVITGATLLEDAAADATVVPVGGTQGIVEGVVYQLEDEVVSVTTIQPAVAVVERAVEGSEVGEHSRRAEVFDGRLLNVQRGFDGTSASAHGAGDKLNFTEIRIERAVEGSQTADHAKGAEVLLGNTLVVERGIAESEAAEHENGVLVLDFPAAPDDPPVLVQSCGQFQEAEPTPTVGPTPTVDPNAAQVAVTLADLTLDVDPTSAAAGSMVFGVTNEGAIEHNFRVIRSDLAPDGLPLDGSQVDEEAVDIVTSIDAIAAGASESTTVPLDAASYILICNIPGHYVAGMYAGFEVQ